MFNGDTKSNDKNVIASDETNPLFSKENGKSQLAWITWVI